jgi:hypothetical protein
MTRQPELEQLAGLTAKTLDQVFVVWVKESLSCSRFKAEALTDLVEEVYSPCLAQPWAIYAGPAAMTVVSTDQLGWNLVYGPTHRYPVFGRISGKADLPTVESVWETLIQEEDRLCQDWPTGEYTLWTASKQGSC